MRAGIIAATTANVWRGKRQPLKPHDFMPSFDGPKRTQSTEQMRAAFKAFSAVANRKIKRGNGRKTECDPKSE